MTNDTASAIRQRLRDDMRAAMKEGRRDAVRVLRALMSAIDQAEAPAAASGPVVQHDFAARTAEIARLDLDGDAVRAAIGREVAERERAAAEFERLGMADKAAEMMREAELAARYLAPA